MLVHGDKIRNGDGKGERHREHLIIYFTKYNTNIIRLKKSPIQCMELKKLQANLCIVFNNHRIMNATELITRRLDILPFSRWHIGMILAIGTIWIFDGYQVSLVSLFSKYILNEHTESQYKILATMYQLGCIVGSIFFSIVAYFYGRRVVFMVTLLIYGIGVIFCLCGDIFPLFVLGRFLTGIGVGGEFTAIFTAVDQFLPPKVRGRVDIGIDGTWHLGGCMASIINLAIGDTQKWKGLFGVGLVGLIGLAFIRKSIPQSPRWLIMKGRYTQAHNIVNGIEYSVLNKHFFYKQMGENQNKLSLKLSENQDIIISKQNDTDWKMKQQNKQVSVGGNKSEQQQIQQEEEQEEKKFIPENESNIFNEVKLIFGSYKGRFMISCALIFVQAFFFNSVYYQFPILLKNNFGLSQREISAYMLGLSVCSFVSTLLIGPFFDILGRRKMLLMTYCITGLLLPISNFIKQNSVSLEILTCAIFMFGSPASSAANLIASEIFPTSTRPIVLSAIFVIGMFGGMCGVWVDNYWVSGSLMIVGGVIGFVFCPKAENKSLQQINNISKENHLPIE